MPKLTDTQSILLSHAAQRGSLSLYPLPDSVALGARAAKAIGSLIAAGFAEERPTSTRDAIVRTDGDLTFGVFATDTGLAAIGIELDTKGDGEGAQPAQTAAPAKAIPGPTKIATVLDLLRGEHGVTLADMTTATNWLPHTMRAALTGLRKKGHAIERFKRDDATCYRIAG